LNIGEGFKSRRYARLLTILEFASNRQSLANRALSNPKKSKDLQMGALTDGARGRDRTADTVFFSWYVGPLSS
jgi:hypothetical protein